MTGLERQISAMKENRVEFWIMQAHKVCERLGLPSQALLEAIGLVRTALGEAWMEETIARQNRLGTMMS